VATIGEVKGKIAAAGGHLDEGRAALDKARASLGDVIVAVEEAQALIQDVRKTDVSITLGHYLGIMDEITRVTKESWGKLDDIKPHFTAAQESGKTYIGVMSS